MLRPLLPIGLLAAAGNAAALAPPQGGGAPSAPPNVLIVVADDLGYGDVGCFGSSAIATPNIDRLASEGVKLTSFYVQPVCSPTRAALLTGQYSQRVGIVGPFARWSAIGLDPLEETIAEQLRARNYHTGFFGKWHVGDSPEQMPLNQGFDDWLTTPWGVPVEPDVLFDSQGATRWDTDPREWTAEFTARTLQFISDAVLMERPFFGILAHHAPHFPATPGRDFIGLSADGREYGDAVEEIDFGVGQILERLDLLGIAGNTLVVFLSDNGPSDQLGAYQQGSAGPLRGFKASTFEGGVRVPCVMRWPSGLPSAVVRDAPLFVADLYPTLLSIVEGAPWQGFPVDGRNVADVLTTGAPLPPGEDAVYFTQGAFTVEGVRRGPWKLRLGELYDLDQDIGETTDVAAAHPAIVAELEALRAAFQADLQANRRAPAQTSRRRSTWRGEVGTPAAGTTLAHGDAWLDYNGNVEPWLVVDEDPNASLSLVPSPPVHPFLAPPRVVRADSASPDVRLERAGHEFAGLAGGPFTLALWWHPVAGPDQDLVLLDIGNADRGVSLTVGDLGILGDDAAPGRYDDLRVRVGGAASPASVTIDVDLPRGDDDLKLIAVSVGSDGETAVFLNGIEAARANAGGSVHWGGDLTWALLGRTGSLGGAGGWGDLPLPASAGRGEVGGIRVFDRELLRIEMEEEYVRFGMFSYCSPIPNSLGLDASFDVFGSFLPSDLSLRGRVEGLPAGSIGFVVAGTQQTRTPLLGAYLCIDGNVRRVQCSLAVATSSVLELDILRPTDPSVVRTPWLPAPGSQWQLQFVYRDMADLRTSNARCIMFGI